MVKNDLAGVAHAITDRLLAEMLRRDPSQDHDRIVNLIRTTDAAHLTAASLVAFAQHVVHHDAQATQGSDTCEPEPRPDAGPGPDTEPEPTNPEVHLAQAFSSYAVRLEQAGHHRKALDLSDRAIRLWETLATRDPAHNHGLAIELNNYASLLADHGRYREALQFSHRAVEMREALAAREPVVHDLDLAAALTNHARWLAANGQPRQGLEVSHRAVALREVLVSRDAAAHNPGLATTLNNHAVRLAVMGHASEAVDSSSRAVSLWETLALDDPVTYDPHLVVGLDVCAALLLRAGDHRQAWALKDRAKQVNRRMNARQPLDLDLVDELVDHAALLVPTDPDRQVWDGSASAVAFWEASAEDSPTDDPGHEPSTGTTAQGLRAGIATALTNHARQLAETGYHDEALDTVKQATALWEALAKEGPPIRDLAFAAALSACATHLTKAGHHDEAAACTARAQAARQAAQDVQTDRQPPRWSRLGWRRRPGRFPKSQLISGRPQTTRGSSH